jgi:hypothetical protein
MSKMKIRFGKQVCADTIMLRRGRGWHSRRLINGSTSFRELISHFVPLNGLQHGQFTEAQIIATLSDIVGARNGVATFRVYSNPYTTRYAQVAASWQSHCPGGYNAQLGYLQGVMFAAFLQASGIIACEGDFHAMIPEYVDQFVPSLSEILGFVALDSTLEQFRRYWEDAVKELKRVRDNTSNMHMSSVAYYLTRFWDDVVDVFDTEVATLNRYAPHLTSVIWHALFDQEDFVPRVIDPASIGQMLRASNFVVEAINNGVGSAMVDYQESWALHLYQKIYTTASREDSYLEIGDTLAKFKDAINVLDFKGHKGGEDLLRVIRPAKLKTYDIQVGRQRNAHAQGNGFYFLPDSEATGRLSTFINDVMRLLAVDKVWTEQMDHHYGTAVQYVSVLNQNDASINLLRDAAAIALAQEVELTPGASPIYHIISNPETYKRIYGVDLVRGGVQRVVGAARVVAATLPQILEDRDIIKHQVPFYDLKSDEVTTLPQQNTALTVLPSFNASILDYEGNVHAKRLTLQRALGLLTATDLTMIQNQYLIDEVNFIVPHWSQIVNHAGDYGPFLGMWLRAALAMSKQYFGALTPSLIQQTSSFIPREEVETREIRLINAANTFAVTTGVIGLVSQPLANLYTSVLQSALSQHHLYTMVD